MFGYPREKGSWGAFVILDSETFSVEVYDTNKWMHHCLTYKKSSGTLQYIVVGTGKSSFGHNSRCFIKFFCRMGKPLFWVTRKTIPMPKE